MKTSSSCKNLRERIEYLMETKNIKSLRAFALLMDVDPAYLHRVLKGDQRMPDNLVAKISRAFAMAPGWVLHGDKSIDTGIRPYSSAEYSLGKLTIQELTSIISLELGDLDLAAQLASLRNAAATELKTRLS